MSPIPNAKLFDKLEDLWEYCRVCPRCQNERSITISVGDDELFQLEDFNKKDNRLAISCWFRNYIYYRMDFVVDCQTNIFEIEIIEPKNQLKDYTSHPSSNVPYFFFYMNGHCIKCDTNSFSSIDIDIDLTTKTLKQIGLEIEYHQIKEYGLVVNYIDGDITVFDDGDLYMGEIGRLPIIPLDFSDIDELYRELQTLLTFS